MSRLQKYKESLQRFVKEKNCLLVSNVYKSKNYDCKCEGDECNKTCDNNVNCLNCKKCDACMNCTRCKTNKVSLLCTNCVECKNCFNCRMCNRDINNYIYSLIQQNDSIYSTLFLTIMNNQNKKHHLSVQGYYIAVAIELMDVLGTVVENCSNIQKIFGTNGYAKMCNCLFICAEKALQQNMNSVKNLYLPNNLNNIILRSIVLLTETYRNIMELGDHVIDVTNKGCSLNIVDWFLKNDDALSKKFKSLSQVSKESLAIYTCKKFFYMSDLTIMLGWMFGNGNVEDIDHFKRTGKYFGMIYALSKDFRTLEKDVNGANIHSLNYVVNFGLQDGYEEFINNKQSFISDMLGQDLYTITVKEIVEKIEFDIDSIIDLTSPDLKSSYSTKVSSSI